MSLDRMPYKLRKAPNRDLYWVVNKETGKKHSNEPLPLERAKAQMRALYASENDNTSGGMDRPKPYSRPVAPIQMTGGRKGEHPVAFADRILSEPRLFSKKQLREARRIKKLEGAGFFGDLWNAAKSVGKKVVSVVSNVVSGNAIRNDYPPYVRKLLAEVGNRPIAQMFVRRDPIQSLLNTALNFISRGKWNEVKSKYAYDNLFHLGLEVVVKMSDQDDIYKRYVIEKNEVINVENAKAFTDKSEVMPVQMGGTGHTINTLLNGAKQVMG